MESKRLQRCFRGEFDDLEPFHLVKLKLKEKVTRFLTSGMSMPINNLPEWKCYFWQTILPFISTICQKGRIGYQQLHFQYGFVADCRCKKKLCWSLTIMRDTSQCHVLLGHWKYTYSTGLCWMRPHRQARNALKATYTGLLVRAMLRACALLAYAVRHPWAPKDGQRW